MKRGLIWTAAIGCAVIAFLAWHSPIKANPLHDPMSSSNASNATFLPSIHSNPISNDASTPACSIFVDSAAGSSGSGTQSSPYKTLTGHTAQSAGKTICLRGTTSGSGRAYTQAMLILSGNGTSSQPITLMAYPGEKAVVRTTSQSVLDVRGDYWQILNLEIDENGGGTSPVILRNRFDVLRGNDIHNGTYNGIEVRGTDALIDANQIHNFDSHRPGSDAHCVDLLQTGDRLILRGNTIHDCSGDGIQAFNPNNTPASNVPEDVQIVNNTFYRGSLAYTENAIDLKIGNRFTITGNDISGYGYEPTQLYQGGNPAVMFHRYVQNVIFSDNKVHDATKGVNIYADQGATPLGVTISNNLFYHLTGTTSVFAYAVQVNVAKSTTIVNNTISNVTGFALSIAAGMSGGRVQNNLVYASGPSRFNGLSGVTVGNNGFFSSAYTGSVGSNNTTGTSPDFVNGTQNLHLQSNSPAIDKGTSAGVTVDFDGNTRTAPPDLGALEYKP
jgi:hypothetical protein